LGKYFIQHPPWNQFGQRLLQQLVLGITEQALGPHTDPEDLSVSIEHDHRAGGTIKKEIDDLFRRFPMGRFELQLRHPLTQYFAFLCQLEFQQTIRFLQRLLHLFVFFDIDQDRSIDERIAFRISHRDTVQSHEQIRATFYRQPHLDTADSLGARAIAQVAYKPVAVDHRHEQLKRLLDQSGGFIPEQACGREIQRADEAVLIQVQVAYRREVKQIGESTVGFNQILLRPPQFIVLHFEFDAMYIQLVNQFFDGVRRKRTGING
jgi:hypothetical protein